MFDSFVTDAAHRSQLDAVPDPDNTANSIWADTSRGNATRGRECSRTRSSGARVRHREASDGVDGPRTIGLAWSMAKITLAKLTYDTRRLVWIEGRTAPAWPLPYSEAVNRIPPVQPDDNARAGQRTPRNGRTASITAHRNRLLEVSDRHMFGRPRHFSRIASTAVKSRPAFRRSIPHPSPATGNAPKPRQRI